MILNDRILSGNSGPAHAHFLPGHVLFLFSCISIPSKGSTFQQEVVHWDKGLLGIRHPFNL